MTWKLFCSPIRDVVIFYPMFYDEEREQAGGINDGVLWGN
ncbi:hypothetical protein B4134_3370 [Bacillus safensis]|nr:hypothetical protein B4134_3370 [Bacillus safensis]